MRFYTEGVFEPPLVGLGTTYDNHLRLIGKRVVDFLSVLIELISLGVTAKVHTSEYRFKISDFAPTGAVSPKISDRRGHPHQPFFFLKN